MSKQIKQPLQQLTLRLDSVKTFPKGQKVALYFCLQLNKYFSLNYGKEGIELTESDFSVIEKLKTIEGIEPLHFNNGSILNIDKECSEHILELYEDLSEGKADFESFILESDTNFLKLLEYSTNKFNKET